MKNRIFTGTMWLLIAVIFVGCTTNEPLTQPTALQDRICARLESPTRTMLDGTAITWSQGDKIALLHAGTPNKIAEYTLIAEGDKGSTNGIFTGEALGEGAPYALYPYAAGVTFIENKFHFTLPATQTYAPKSFGQRANPMVAKSNADNVLEFKNLCGVIKLQLLGTQTVSKITLTAVNEQVAGDMMVDMSYTTHPALLLDKAGTKSLTLEGINARLDATAPTSFYFVVPAQRYAAGLKFTLRNDKGEEIITKITTKELLVNRSKVSALPPVSTEQLVAFPDPAFRAELVALGLTEKDGDIAISPEKFNEIVMLDLRNKGLHSLKGVELFKSLKQLKCSGNNLSTLDVSGCTKLQELKCLNNKLTNLSIGGCSNLTVLNCSKNNLFILDISTNLALTTLFCDNNRLMTLNICGLQNLSLLECGGQCVNDAPNSTLILLLTADQQSRGFGTGTGNEGVVPSVKP